MSEKYLLLRVVDEEALKQALANQRAQLLECCVAKNTPLLAELWQALQRRGLGQQSGRALFWCRFEDERAVEYYLDFNEVECCFTRAWLEQAAAEAERDQEPWALAVARRVAAWPLKAPTRELAP